MKGLSLTEKGTTITVIEGLWTAVESSKPGTVLSEPEAARATWAYRSGLAAVLDTRQPACRLCP
jgi:hypothetical protein